MVNGSNAWRAALVNAGLYQPMDWNIRLVGIIRGIPFLILSQSREARKGKNNKKRVKY